MAKKIMFNDKYGLTQAVLEGRKTQTRRMITYPKKLHGQDVCGYYVCRRTTDEAITEVCMYDENESFIDEGQILPKYNVGEVVAVAQSYKDAGFRPNKILYRSIPKIDGYKQEAAASQKGWSNKMFVAANLMPHQIRITDVRVERLQDISDEDCLKEGIEEINMSLEQEDYRYCFYDNTKELWDKYITPQEAFARLINKVSRKDVWSLNPYVFVYDFELVR